MKLCQSFVPISKTEHLVKSFDCGKPGMNSFLSQFAEKHAKLGLSRTLVLTEDSKSSNKKRIAAYYTLAAATVLRQQIPTDLSLPRYPLPVVLLARLAVDLQYQQRNLGAKSLIYALRHAVRLCDQGLPACGLILDVLDEDAMKFYQRFEIFHSFTDYPARLFVPMNLLRKI